MLVNVLLANSIPTTLPSGFFPQVWFFLKYYYMSFLRGMGVTFIVSVVGTIFAVKMDTDAVERVSTHVVDACKEYAIAGNSDR